MADWCWYSRLPRLEPWSSPSRREFDFFIDTDGDGVADFSVVGVDLGLITTGDYSGQIAAAVFDLKTNRGSVDFFAKASTDSSTMLIPVRASRLGLDASTRPRFSYTVRGYDLDEIGASDSFAKAAAYNPFSKAITDGQFATLGPNGAASVPFSVNLAELSLTPALGLMVVTQDNENGNDEANLVKIEVKLDNNSASVVTVGTVP